MIASLLCIVAALGAASPAAPGAEPAPRRIGAVRAGADSGLARALPDSVHLLPGIAVERERAAHAARRRLPTAFVTELEARPDGHALASVAQVLEQAAGVSVTQYGGLGAFSTVSLRGAAPGQVAIYLDGVPLTSAAHGVVSLADLPATAIERIEVYRGLSPLALGAGAPGGAINLITSAAPAVREASVSRGSFDTWQAHASAGAARGDATALVRLGYQGSRGDFRYHDDNGTPFNPDDDAVTTRSNARFDAASAVARAAWRPGGGLELGVREDLFRRMQGVPGLGAVPALHPRLAFERSLTSLDLARAGEGWVPELRAAATLTRERSRFRDTGAELGLGAHDTDDRFGGEQGTLGLRWDRLPGGVTLEGSASARTERAELSDALSAAPAPPASRRLTRAAMATVEWRPVERLVLHAARRWDRLEDRLRSNGVGGRLQASDGARVLDSPQLGVRAALGLGLAARANWARAERPPDFMELFGNQGSVTGNPALRPERAENRDFGLGWNGGARGLRAAVEWARFASTVEDLILYVRSSQSSVRAQNVTRARIHGEELSARLVSPWGLEASAALTWQSALDDGPVPYWHGKRLPQRPGRLAFARLGWERGRLALAADLHYLGDDYLDAYNRYRVPSRTLVGASAALALAAGRLRLSLEGRNLGDVRASDVAGFPLPGRSVFLGCEARLGPSPTPHP